MDEEENMTPRSQTVWPAFIAWPIYIAVSLWNRITRRSRA